MSTFLDVTVTDEGKGKGRAPKEEMYWKSNLGHIVKSCMTVI